MKSLSEIINGIDKERVLDFLYETGLCILFGGVILTTLVIAGSVIWYVVLNKWVIGFVVSSYIIGRIIWWYLNRDIDTIDMDLSDKKNS